MDASEHDVLAYMAVPRQHRTKLHRTNPIERLNKQVKRRANVVGFGHAFGPMAVMPSLPNEASIARLIGAVLFGHHEDWQTASRDMRVKAFAQTDDKETDPILIITTQAA